MTIEKCRCGNILPTVKLTEIPFEFCSKFCKRQAELQDRLDDAFESDKTHTKDFS